MSIENYGITFVAECDSCSETFDTGCDREDGFHQAVSVIKKEGWAISRRKGEWIHTCPSCQEDAFDNLEEGD